MTKVKGTCHHAVYLLQVSEAAVVSRPHPVKGECLYCFITPSSGAGFDAELVKELKTQGNSVVFFFSFFKNNFLDCGQITKKTFWPVVGG